MKLDIPQRWQSGRELLSDAMSEQVDRLVALQDERLRPKGQRGLDEWTH